MTLFNSFIIGDEKMSDLENPVLQQWVKIEVALHRFHDINFKRKGPMGAPQRGQGRLLHIIKKNPNITQKELCEKSGLRQQSVSEFLKKLENSGYISRTSSPCDKRVSTFNLTEEGEKLARPPVEVIQQLNSFLSCLNDEEQQNMCDYLKRIRYNIEKMLNQNKNE